MEEEKEIKKKKSKNIIIVLLVLIICLLIAYIAYDKLLTKQSPQESKKSVTENEKTEIDDNKEDDKKKEEISKQLTESDVLDYIANINKVLVSFANKVPMKTSDISNDELLEFAFWKAEWKGEQKTAESVSKVIEDIFGKDYSYHLGDIQCFVGDGIIYQYNQAEGTFNRVGEHGHGGGSGYSPRIYFIEGKQTSDTITIKAKVLYGERCGDICGPSSYFYDKATYKNGEEIYKTDNNHDDDYDYVYNEVKDKLPITTFILKKQSDGRFALTEIK